MDTRLMAKAGEQSHLHIPIPQELKCEFQGSNRFSIIDFNHTVHQIVRDENPGSCAHFTCQGPYTDSIHGSWEHTQEAVSSGKRSEE